MTANRWLVIAIALLTVLAALLTASGWLTWGWGPREPEYEHHDVHMHRQVDTA